MKVVVNKCYGGFGLSTSAFERLIELGNKTAIEYRGKWINSLENLHAHGAIDPHIARHDPQLVQVVEELGTRANGKFANLLIVEIPDGEEYEIYEYDGMETVERPRLVWG